MEKKYWKEIIAERERSGLTVAAFCKKHGLPVTRYYYHKRRLNKGKIAERKKETDFAQVKVTEERPEKTSPKIRFHTPDGYIVEVFI